MKSCARKGCPRAATHYLEWRAWATGFPKTSPHLTGVIGIPLCRAHAESASADEMIDEAAWRSISDAVAAAGRVRPDRNSLELVARCGSPDAVFAAATSQPRRH